MIASNAMKTRMITAKIICYHRPIFQQPPPSTVGVPRIGRKEDSSRSASNGRRGKDTPVATFIVKSRPVSRIDKSVNYSQAKKKCTEIGASKAKGKTAMIVP
jgi:hypothetical protein